MSHCRTLSAFRVPALLQTAVSNAQSMHACDAHHKHMNLCCTTRHQLHLVLSPLSSQLQVKLAGATVVKVAGAMCCHPKSSGCIYMFAAAGEPNQTFSGTMSMVVCTDTSSYLLCLIAYLQCCNLWAACCCRMGSAQCHSSITPSTAAAPPGQHNSTAAASKTSRG